MKRTLLGIALSIGIYVSALPAAEPKPLFDGKPLDGWRIAKENAYQFPGEGRHRASPRPHRDRRRVDDRISDDEL
jgi:hypothetical protein